jgi:hypothetical protein
MQREGMTLPLLIGGATTSRVHTAVKIAPHYSGPTVYVPDASRAVGVTTQLLSRDACAPFVAEVAADYARIREQHARRKGPALVALAQARANAFRTDWTAYAPPRPSFIGRREFRNVDLAQVAELIDWAPFFQTWELRGFSGDPRRPCRRRARARRPGGRHGDAAASSAAGRCERRSRLLAGEFARRGRRALARRGAQGARAGVAPPAPAGRVPTASPTTHSLTSSRWKAAWRTDRYLRRRGLHRAQARRV